MPEAEYGGLILGTEEDIDGCCWSLVWVDGCTMVREKGRLVENNG